MRNPKNSWDRSDSTYDIYDVTRGDITIKELKEYDSNAYVDFTLDKEKKTINAKHSVRFASGIAKGKTFYGRNFLEELDYPGEKWISNDGILYAYLPENAKTGLIELNMLEDDMINGKNAENIYFKNISFDTSAGKLFNIKGCKDMEFNGCNFSNSSENSIDGYRIGVKNCNFLDSDLYVLGGNHDTLERAENYVENSDFNNSFLRIWGVGNRASYNVCHERTGVGLQFGHELNTIEYNEFYNCLTYFSDGGVIYGFNSSAGRGNRVMYNYMHDCINEMVADGSKICGIYLDDGSSGTLCAGNIIDNLNNGSARAFHLGGTTDTIVHNNIILNMNVGIFFDQRVAGAFAGTWAPTGKAGMDLTRVPYKSDIWKEAFPELYNIIFDTL